MARIVVLEILSQVPAQGIVRSQDSTERSWFKVSRFCYMLMKYSCDRQEPPRSLDERCGLWPQSEDVGQQNEKLCAPRCLNLR